MSEKSDDTPNSALIGDVAASLISAAPADADWLHFLYGAMRARLLSGSPFTQDDFDRTRGAYIEILRIGSAL